METHGTAIVLQSTGSWYRLRDDAGHLFDARIRGRLRLSGTRSTNPVVVGDRVDYENDPQAEAVITAIHPRRNYIIRRASNLSKESQIIAANIDHVFLVATLFAPETSYEFIDRFLVTCEAYDIPAAIVLNKRDLIAQQPGAAEAFAAFLETYALAGYPVVPVSAITREGVETLQEMIAGQTSLFAGNSGVGKSSLIRELEPTAEVRTAEVSHAHHKGRHTTTFSQMIPLTGSEGGHIIDTPGIKGFGLIDIDLCELFHYFPEMMRVAPGCQYYNCTHRHEPGCAVQQAVENGEISENRYISYLKIFEEDGKYRK